MTTLFVLVGFALGIAFSAAVLTIIAIIKDRNQ